MTNEATNTEALDCFNAMLNGSDMGSRYFHQSHIDTIRKALTNVSQQPVQGWQPIDEKPGASTRRLETNGLPLDIQAREYAENQHEVWLKIGGQEFSIGRPWDTAEEAAWAVDMLVKAFMSSVYAAPAEQPVGKAVRKCASPQEPADKSER